MKALILVSKGSCIIETPSWRGQLVSDGVHFADPIDDDGQLLSFNYKKQNTTQDPYLLGYLA